MILIVTEEGFEKNHAELSRLRVQYSAATSDKDAQDILRRAQEIEAAILRYCESNTAARHEAERNRN